MNRTPLVVLGFDVGDAGLIERFADEGRMPVAARILGRGVRARTGGPEYMTEHGVWLSLATGLSRARTGYYYFRQLVPGTYELRPTTGHDFEATPFWSELTGKGRGAVIDIPDAPLVEGLDGVQLLDFATHQPSMTAHGPSARPSSLLAEARRIYGRFEPTWEFERGASAAVDRAACAALLERVARKSRLCRHLVAEGDFDFVCVSFSEAHPAGHRFWRYQGDPRSGLDGALRDVYAAIDRAMGELLEAVGGEPDVVLLTTLGMTAHYPTADLADGFCRLLGYQVAPRRESGSIGLAARLAALAPEGLRALAARLPERVQERRLSERFRASTDWGRSVAFAIPGLHAGFIRVNLAGREPEGTVAAGAGYRELLEEIEAELARLVDPRAGGPAVRRVYRTAELAGGAPPAHLPDLVVEWHSTPHFLDRIVHPRGEVHQTMPRYCPDTYHILEGLFAAAGPSVAAGGDLGPIDVLDVAPTCLGLLGVPPPAVMGGRNVLSSGQVSSPRAAS